MKWLLIIGNLFAALVIYLAAQAAAATHRSHAYSTYRDLQVNKVLNERADYDVLEKIKNAGGSGNLFLYVASYGAAACLANAITVAIAWPKKVSTSPSKS